MTGRAIIIGFAAASLVAASTLPAAAQMDDFLCSTFSFHCEPPPPPPPPTPALAPEAAPEQPVKHAHKAHKKKAAKAKAAKTDSDAAPEAAPK